MPLLLNIDTATEHASVCLSKDDDILGLIESTEQKNHASFVQPAIEKLFKDYGQTLKDIDAVAVTAGPGSYTGLRVGLASAKGICYALDKPLILKNTLEVMAESIVSYYRTANQPINPNSVLCPMIDARRMEVFTAMYNSSLQELTPPHALILDTPYFDDLLKNTPVIFCGSGHNKLKSIISSPSASFCDVQHNAIDLATLATISFMNRQFADLAYCEPLYVKEFFSVAAKNK
jgi:tRNA threonylcarbamoyladenosine biosynthesis protein TsaB